MVKEGELGVDMNFVWILCLAEYPLLIFCQKNGRSRTLHIGKHQLAKFMVCFLVDLRWVTVCGTKSLFDVNIGPRSTEQR